MNLTSDTPGGVRIDGLPEPLVIRQLYLGCLSQAAYLVGDTESGRGIVVDPRRDVEEILTAATDEGLDIELVVLTHFHADFLSGHLEVAAATGAEVAFGSAAETEFPSRSLHDGERIELGRVGIEIWETPGHTPESVSLIIRVDDAEPAAVLTGDTLFIGDVGRPDLLVAADIPAETLGSQLYDSVHRLAGLPEATLVLPAHGAGSACGKSLSTETVSTIGEQRETNYALAPMDRDRFIAIVTEGQAAAPDYFGYDAKLNRQIRPIFDESEPLRLLDLDALDAAVADGAVVLDTRPTMDFALGHLRGSLGVGLDGRFAEQAGSVVDPHTPVVLVAADEAEATEARLRLARIGFDTVVGALLEVDGVLAEHPERARRLSRLTATGLEERIGLLGDDLQIVDVRNPGEIEAAPLDGTIEIPLADLRSRLDDLDRNRPIVAVCAGGARSAIAASVLEAAGFDDVSDVLGGAEALGLSPACSLTPTT